MKFHDKFRWSKRTRKLLRIGNDTQKKGIKIGTELISKLKLDPEKLLLIGNFTHVQLAHNKIELQLEVLPQNLLKQAIAIVKKISNKLKVKKIIITRNLHSIQILFFWKNWQFEITFIDKKSDSPKRAWIRDFLLNEMGPIHIAKVLAFISSGVKSSNAFKEILKNWVPDNRAIQRLVEFQLTDPKDKPLIKLIIKKNKIKTYIYKNKKWKNY